MTNDASSRDIEAARQWVDQQLDAAGMTPEQRTSYYERYSWEGDTDAPAPTKFISGPQEPRNDGQ